MKSVTLRPLLDPLYTPVFTRAHQKSCILNARVRTCLIQALLMSFGSSQAEPKIFILCPAKNGHWQSIWQNSFCPHSFQIMLSERPITCRCHFNVHWLANLLPVYTCFLSKASRSLERFSIGCLMKNFECLMPSWHLSIWSAPCQPPLNLSLPTRNEIGILQVAGR